MSNYEYHACMFAINVMCVHIFACSFDDTNSEGLRRIASEKYLDAGDYNFDPKSIDWEDYYMNTHIPGLAKHVIIKHSQSRL